MDRRVWRVCIYTYSFTYYKYICFLVIIEEGFIKNLECKNCMIIILWRCGARTRIMGVLQGLVSQRHQRGGMIRWGKSRQCCRHRSESPRRLIVLFMSFISFLPLTLLMPALNMSRSFLFSLNINYCMCCKSSLFINYRWPFYVIIFRFSLSILCSVFNIINWFGLMTTVMMVWVCVC